MGSCEYKISVIIPAFNAEKTIETCIDGLLSQTLRDIEIIVVDDCSSDKTSAIMSDYEKTYADVTLISLDKNVGSGLARNAGLIHATGEYIGFSDADDWIDSAAYEQMYVAAKSFDADMAVCGMATEWGDYLASSQRYAYPSLTILEGRQALRSFTRSVSWDVVLSAIVNNKIYRADLLKENSISFTAERYAQDNYFTFFALAFSNRVALVPGVAFHYLQRDESESHSFTTDYLDGMIETLSDIKEELARRDIYEVYQDEYKSLLHRCVDSTVRRMFAQYGQNSKTRDLTCHFIEESVRKFGLSFLLDTLDVETLRKLTTS